MRVHDTDKLGHGYGPTYTALARRAYPGAAVLEIGTADGAGLRYFRQLMRHSVLVGVDREVTAGARAAADFIVQADQQDPKLAELIDSAVGSWTEFHLIVDDASHENFATYKTLVTMWPRLAPAGTYVIEDWSHANLISGPLAADITSAFADNPALRRIALPGLDSALYRPGMILLRKGPNRVDHVPPG